VRGVVGRRLLDDVAQGIPFESTTRQDAPITRIEESSAKIDLEHLKSYIEIFCEDEIIIRDRTRPRESQILFTQWANEVCQRIGGLVSKAANSDKKR
jgi:hypothetical protein